ncbi:hypothetical protein [Amycolatopsis sp. NPDC059657]|uniref:hypothetical protein n=1 Tax=Amycolatopsis sp. NPDC059657 TaxID=3346899 RepID=UPI003672512B
MSAASGIRPAEQTGVDALVGDLSQYMPTVLRIQVPAHPTLAKWGRLVSASMFSGLALGAVLCFVAAGIAFALAVSR